MCFYFDINSQPAKGCVAKNDIVCYKLLVYTENRFISPYFRKTEWIAGETKKSGIYVSEDEIVEVSYTNAYGHAVTFHESRRIVDGYYENAGNSPGMYNEMKESETTTSLRKITNGLYSFSGYMNCKMKVELNLQNSRKSPVAIVECVIPKGSTYYKDKDSTQFVSDALKFVEVVEFFNCEGPKAQ